MLATREVEAVFENMICLVECRGLSSGEVETEANVLFRIPLRAGAGAVARHNAHRRYLEQRRRVWRQRFFDGCDLGQRRVFDLYAFERSDCTCLVLGGDGGNDIADVANLVERDDRLVLDKIAIGRVEPLKVVAGQHRGDPRDFTRLARVDRYEPCMGVRTAQCLGDQHAGQVDVDRVDGGARDLGVRVLSWAHGAD